MRRNTLLTIVASILFAMLLLGLAPSFFHFTPHQQFDGTTTEPADHGFASPDPSLPHATQEKNIYSLVLFLKAPRTLDIGSLSAAAERAFGSPFNRDPDHQCKALPRPGLYGIHTSTADLGIINSDRPYLDDQALADAVDRAREFMVKRAFQDHKAWLSADWIGPLPEGGETAAYASISRLLAELLNDDVLAIYSTTPQRMHTSRPTDIATLRSPQPLSIFNQPPEDPVVYAKDDDAALAATVDEARRCWPEFVAAFSNRRPMQGFAVKKAFESEGKFEHMWVEISSIDGGKLTGKLVNDPNIIDNIKLNDPITLTADQVEDWIYSDGKQMIGGFSAKVLQKEK